MKNTESFYELNRKVLAIDVSAKKVVNKVRINAADIKRSLNSLTSIEKEVFTSRFKSDVVRDYMRGSKGYKIDDCFIGVRSIQVHKKEGFTGIPEPKTLDFYSFYFDDNVTELKTYIHNLKKKTKNEEATKEINEGNNFPVNDNLSEDAEVSKTEYLKLIGFGFFTVVGLCVALFLFGIIKNPFKSTSVFDADDDRYKILVLPFKQECQYDGSLKNVGYVIEKRLVDLSEKDSLNLNVRYLPDFKINRLEQDSTWTLYYNRIMKENGANHIIYGSTREENCSSSNSDEVCINFLVSNISNPINSPVANLYSPFQKASIPEISEGKLQGNIDMIIYMQAISSIELKDPYKALYYLDKILDGSLQNNDEEVLFRLMKVQILLKLQENEGVKNECAKILKLNINVPEAMSIISACTIALQDLTLDEFISSLSDKQKDDFYIQLLIAIYTVPIDIDDAKASMQNILDNCSDLTLKTTLVSSFIKELNNNHYYEEAIYFASLLLKENPRDFSLLMDRGIAYLSIDSDLEKPEADFKNALKIYPNSSNAHLRLASVFLFKGNRNNFRYYFKKALEYDPNNPYLYSFMIDATYKAGAYYDMFDISDEAIKKYPIKWDFEFTALIYRTFANKNLNKLEEYKKDSLKILEIAPHFFKERELARASGMYVIE